MSSFFWRNPLQQQIVLGLLRGLYRPEGAVRILDVGSSAGEMILTYAILLADEYGDQWHERFPITCVEKDPELYKRFCRGIYDAVRLYQMPHSYRLRYFQNFAADPMPETVRAQDRLALLKNLNLSRRLTFHNCDFGSFRPDGQSERSRPPGRFEVIFCQNTLLHLDVIQAWAFTGEMHAMLAPGGYFICAGRHANSCELLRKLKFEPVPHNVKMVYSEWLQRKHAKQPLIALKAYDPADPLLAYKIGSIFRKARSDDQAADSN